MTGTPAVLDVHELLAEQDFVRRLARSLVFDQDRVDDVVQDAWLAALRRPPRDRGAFSTWAGRVVHNLARRRARDDARRLRREAAAAAPEALPSAADVIAREQQRQQVVEAVLALPEPYRGTVLARFFDDLQPGEIARRRGVPAATVRSQLLRAVAMLRQRLDHLYGGQRRAWCVLLLPLARPERGMGGLTLTAGALLMAKSIAVAMVLALGLIGYLWIRDDAAAAPVGAEVAAAAPAPAAAAAEPPSNADETARRVPVATAAAAPIAPATAGLRGRVVFADGTPAGDQLVRVIGVDSTTLFADAGGRGERRGPALPSGRARTAADGTFAIAGIWPRVRYAVHAGADGDDRTLRIVDATPGPGDTADVGDLVLVRKGRITGRAVDDGGAGLAGAEVLAFDLPAVLAAILPFERLEPRNGAFLGVPLPTDGEHLSAYRTRLRRFLAADLFQKEGLDRRPGMTTLVVEQAPWLGELWSELPIARAVSGADGRFELRGVEPGGNMLVVRAPDHAVATRPRVLVQAGAANDVGDVRLASGEELCGTVRSAGGGPVAGAEVRVGAIGVLGYRGIAFCEAPVVTDAGGRFRKGGLPRGRALVGVRASAHAPWFVEGPVASDDDLVITLPATGELVLQVARGDGVAVEAPEFELFAGPPLNELRRAGLQAPVPLQGRVEGRGAGVFALRDLPPGTYTLRVAAAGTAGAEAIVALPRSEPLALELPAAAALSVRVRDAEDRPVAGAKIYLHRSKPSAAEENVLPTDYGMPRWLKLPQLAGATDAQGQLMVGTRPAEAVVVYAAHATLPAAAATVEATQSEVLLVLPRPGRLEGRLFDHGQAADPRRWCVVAQATWLEEMPRPELRATLQPDGSFTFANLPPGKCDVRAEPRATAAVSLQALVEQLHDVTMGSFFGESPVEHRVDVPAGATASLSFDADPNQPTPGVQAAHLDGRARQDGRPLAGAELQRRVDLFRFATIATVQADGTFAVPALAPGAQALKLVLGEDVLWAGTVEVAPGGSRFLDLNWSSGSLAGNAAFASGQAPLGLDAIAEGRDSSGTFERHVPIDASGRFSFAALPAGEYEVRAHGAGGYCKPVQATITAGAAAAPVRLELLEFQVLCGRIELGGRRAGGAFLWLKSDQNWAGRQLGDDGVFAFGELQRRVYELALQLDDKDVPLEPHRFDLQDGNSVRDVTVRIAPDAPRTGR